MQVRIHPDFIMESRLQGWGKRNLPGPSVPRMCWKVVALKMVETISLDPRIWVHFNGLHTQHHNRSILDTDSVYIYIHNIYICEVYIIYLPFMFHLQGTTTICMIDMHILKFYNHLQWEWGFAALNLTGNFPPDLESFEAASNLSNGTRNFEDSGHSKSHSEPAPSPRSRTWKERSSMIATSHLILTPV